MIRKTINALVLIITLVAFAATASATPQCAYADLNGSGTVDVVDAQCMILTVRGQMSGGHWPGCLADRGAADLNCDGAITVLDLMIMIDVLTVGLHPDLDTDDDGVHDACQ